MNAPRLAISAILLTSWFVAALSVDLVTMIVTILAFGAVSVARQDAENGARTFTKIQ